MDSVAQTPPPLREGSKNGAGSTTASLHTRLRARHHEAIERFKDASRSFNGQVDAQQQTRLEELHRRLSEDHVSTAALIAEERRRLAESVQEWQTHADTLQHASPEDVLLAYTDVYHPTTNEQGQAIALTLMKEDRLRLARYFVDLRDRYTARMDALRKSFHAMEAAEDARRTHIQSAVRDLMARLTRIAITSTTESQVLAQRILHHTNAQLGQNYLAMQTVAIQLRQRELWKHQQYQQDLSAVCRDTQEHMARRHVTWCLTLLRSKVFHRPEGRLQAVHAAGKLLADIRREAQELVRGLSEVVTSLQRAKPKHVSAEAQVCGGSDPNGWLRSFQASVHEVAVFHGEDPRAVLEEAQMRASVLVRHCRARCEEFASRLNGEEEARAQLAAALAERTLEHVRCLAAPLSEELPLLQRASFTDEDSEDAHATSAKEATKRTGAAAVAVAGVDLALVPLTAPHAQVLAFYESLPNSDAWSRCVPAILEEGRWFTQMVSHGMAEGYRRLRWCTTASPHSMLVYLEGATDVLFASASDLLGAIRRCYRQWHEQEMDYRDEIAALERQLSIQEEQLRQEETPAQAEARYTAALACLQSIAEAHTRYYEDVRRRIASATDSVCGVSQNCVRELSQQLGLSLAPLRASEAVPASKHSFFSSASERRSSAGAGASPRTSSQNNSIAVGGSSHSNTGSTRHSSSANAEPLSATTATTPKASLVAAPRLTAAHGEEFLIERVPLGFTCVIQRINTTAEDREGAADPTSVDEGDTFFSAAAPSDAERRSTPMADPPGDAFQRFYRDLLPELHPGHGLHFLTQHEVQDWTDLLRRVLLEWALRLQRQAGENWRLYTASFQAEIQKRTTDLLLRHRRRPATLQADVYEARLRELADLKNRAEKSLARIAEHVTHMFSLQQALLAQSACTAADQNLVGERVKLLSAVWAASSPHAIQLAVQRHEVLCAQYANALTNRCAEASRDLEQARDILEGEFQQLLRNRAAELAGQAPKDDHGSLEQLPPDDPIQQRVAHLRAQVQKTLAESRQAMEAHRRTRADEVNAWTDEWARVVEQSTAEMKVFQAVQESLTRLRAQAQALLSGGATEESTLAGVLARVVEGAATAAKAVQPLSTSSAASAHDVAAQTQALLQQDANMPASSLLMASRDTAQSAAAATALPSVEEMESVVSNALDVMKAEQRERLRAAPICAVLAALDELRLPLFSRGCRLGAMAHTIELWRLSPTHYLLPRPLGEEDAAAVTGGAFNSRNATMNGSASKNGPRSDRRVRSPNRPQSGRAGAVTTVAGHALLSLPTVTTLLSQVVQWATEVKVTADKQLRRHLDAYPGPLQRRLPGMADGTGEAFTAAVSSLCQAQEERMQTYVHKATPTYRQQVQQLWATLQEMPALLVTTLRTEAATAAVTRAEAVLQPWHRFYAQSRRQWQQRRGSIKVSASHQPHSAVLATLTEEERYRSSVTEAVLHLTWSSVLREVQEEAGLHVARCWTALYTFVHLVSGLVTPQHLVPSLDALERGGSHHHRGLRHLLELRAQHERATAALLESAAQTKKDPTRLQETMPLHRTDTTATSAMQNKRSGRSNDTSTAASSTATTATAGGGGVAHRDALFNPVLSPMPWGTVELPGLPLNACAPLATYNTEHPDTAMTLPVAATTFVPTLNTRDGKSATQGHPRAPARHKNSRTSTSESLATAVSPSKAVYTVETSLPLVVPRWPLVLNCVQLLRAAVRAVEEEDGAVARAITEAFVLYERQEAQLRLTWTRTLADLALWQV